MSAPWRKAIHNGLAYVTEDRKGNGLVLNEDIQFNVSLAHLQAAWLQRA